MTESLENATGTILKAMMERHFAVVAPDATPSVFVDDESAPTEDFLGHVISVEREPEPAVINPGANPTWMMLATVESRSLIPANGEAEADQLSGEVEPAIRSTDATGLDLSRFGMFHVFTPMEGATDESEDGRRIRKRTFKIAVEEAAG